MKAKIIGCLIAYSTAMQGMALDTDYNQRVGSVEKPLWKVASSLVNYVCGRQLLLYNKRVNKKIKELMKISLRDGDPQVINEIQALVSDIKELYKQNINEPFTPHCPIIHINPVIKEKDAALYMRLLRQTIADFVNEKDMYRSASETDIDIQSCSNDVIEECEQWLHVYVLVHNCLHNDAATLRLLKEEVKTVVIQDRNNVPYYFCSGYAKQ